MDDFPPHDEPRPSRGGGFGWRRYLVVVCGCAAAGYAFKLGLGALRFGVSFPFIPWLIRTVAVLALTGLFAVLAADLPSFAHGRRAVIAAIGGVLVTLAITGYLRWLGSRRSGG